MIAWKNILDVKLNNVRCTHCQEKKNIYAGLIPVSDIDSVYRLLNFLSSVILVYTRSSINKTNRIFNNKGSPAEVKLPF